MSNQRPYISLKLIVILMIPVVLIGISLGLAIYSSIGNPNLVSSLLMGMGATISLITLYITQRRR